MSETEQFVRDLLSWGGLHQTCLHPHVEIYQDPVTGLSLRAVQNLPLGSKVVTCPYPISMSYLNAINIAPFTRHSQAFPCRFLKEFGRDDPHIIGHFFLMQQFLLGDKSFWWPYIRLLPQPDESQKLGIIWWPEEDQRFLKGTNAEPAIQERKKLWTAAWEAGIAILKETLLDWEDYGYGLYQWAATIFGTRSFRASLTVPEEIFPGVFDGQSMVHIMKDNFSILLPILDIGNHNGINTLDWQPRLVTGMSLVSRVPVAQGEQIFNFYGNKSNSELLVGYGFILPASSVGKDIVYFKLRPSQGASVLYRDLDCHIVTEDEFLFELKRPESSQGDPKITEVFSHGFIDLLVCMMANYRETKFLSTNRKYCPQEDPGLFEGPLYRSAFCMLQSLHEKIEYDRARHKGSDSNLGPPQNNNQRLALDYRKRQLSVLESAIQLVSSYITNILSRKPLGQPTFYSQPNSRPPTPSIRASTEILSLEDAFDWLRLYYPIIYTILIRAISEDQDEPLPLNWAVLVEDWGHTYWIVWLFVVLRLPAQGSATSNLQPGSLRLWLLSMREFYDYEYENSVDLPILRVEKSEKETIEMMIQTIAHLPEFDSQQNSPSMIPTLQSLASHIAQEETVLMNYRMQNGQLVEQKVLCINPYPFAVSEAPE